MFTGIVQATGTVAAQGSRGGDARLRIRCPALAPAGCRAGESIAVSGVCLTATESDEAGFAADVSAETLRLTTLGGLRPGDTVNLERSLTLATPLGGHLVTGHVDGLATVVSRRPEARSVRFELDVPDGLERYVARKGSVCLDGVSLTVNEVRGRRFRVNIVPHTLAVTTLQGWRPGTRVNLEVDLLARYVERLLGRDEAPRPGAVLAEERGLAESQ